MPSGLLKPKEAYSMETFWMVVVDAMNGEFGCWVRFEPKQHPTPTKLQHRPLNYSTLCVSPAIVYGLATRKMPSNDGSARSSSTTPALLAYQTRLMESPSLSRTSSLSRSGSQTAGILAPNSTSRWSKTHRSAVSSDSTRDRTKRNSVEGACWSDSRFRSTN